MAELDRFKTWNRLGAPDGSEARSSPVLESIGRDPVGDPSLALVTKTDEYLCDQRVETVEQPVFSDPTSSIDLSMPGDRNLWSLDPGDIRDSFPMTREALKIVVTLFRETCFERLEGIAKAMMHGDALEVCRNAHALKGSVGMFGSKLTLEVISNLERAMKDDQPQLAKEHFGRLEVAIEAIQPTLNRLIQDLD
jgi:hypothetical protein